MTPGRTAREAIEQLRRFSWTELLDMVAGYGCALGRSGEEDDAYFYPARAERWIVWQIENSHEATPVGVGGTPGHALIDALLVLCGIDEAGGMAVDAEHLNDDMLDGLRRARATLTEFLDQHDETRGGAASE